MVTLTFISIVLDVINVVIVIKLYKRENYSKKIRGFYDETDIMKIMTSIFEYGI